MRQKEHKLWQAAVAVSAASVLAFSALGYGQSGSSGASRSGEWGLRWPRRDGTSRLA